MHVFVHDVIPHVLGTNEILGTESTLALVTHVIRTRHDDVSLDELLALTLPDLLLLLLEWRTLRELLLNCSRRQLRKQRLNLLIDLLCPRVVLTRDRKERGSDRVLTVILGITSRQDGYVETHAKLVVVLSVPVVDSKHPSKQEHDCVDHVLITHPFVRRPELIQHI